MKKIYILFSTFLLSTLFSGCEEFLTEKPESVLTQFDFYITPTRINQGVLGCYAGLASVVRDEWIFTELRSDNTCQDNPTTSTTQRIDHTDVALFRTSPSLPMLLDYWYKVFKNISNVNAVLPSVRDNTFLPIESQRAQYEGELLFIRALHYYHLVSFFGDMFKVTTVIGPNEAKKIQRSPVAQIYDEIIIPDLIKAGDLLPSTYGAADRGRVTKWAAKALLAKVYMMRGGNANIALAKPLLEEVMSSSPHRLLTGTSAFANVFSTTNEMNDEIIFAVRFRGGALGLGSPFWSLFTPVGSTNLFLKIGTPMGYNAPTFELRSVFEASIGDNRKDASYRIWNRSATSQLPYIFKFNDPNISQANQAENDWIMLRYADVVLLYAEVLAQDGNHGTAHTFVNQIRTRAGLAGLTPFSTNIAALDAVYAERRLELAFENQRWFDLLRMNKSYNDPNKAIDIMKKHVFETDWEILYSKYNPIQPPEQRFFNNYRLLLPIPQTEIDTNNELTIIQNQDY